MPTTECMNCGSDYEWMWEEAFDKFGFDDGNGQIETFQVETVLRNAGYEVESFQGIHNEVICSIKKGEVELMPVNNDQFATGYDSPREYLPEAIINLLDKELG